MYHPLTTRAPSNESQRPLHPSTSSATAGVPAGRSAPSNMSSYPMAERPNTLQKPSFAPAAGHDVERGHAGPYIRLGEHLGVGKSNPNSEPNTPGGLGHSRDSSFLHEATHFDYRKGPEQFRVAQGDIPDNQVKPCPVR
jgi:hypothetical protein